MPEDLYQGLKELGACSRLANLTGFTTIDLPVWAVIRPNGKSGSSTVGKGLTDEQSKYSALFECYELTCAERVEPTGRCEPSTIDNCFHFHPPQIYVDAIEYCEGVKSSTGESIKIPFSCLTMDTTRKYEAYRCSTIGTGAGWDQEQALDSALREFIERYSILMNKENKKWMSLKTTPKSEELLLDNDLEYVIDKCRNKNFHILIRDISTVKNWPCFAVHLVAKTEHGLMVGSGYGCQHESSRAMTQAILEANQGICVAASGIRDDMYKSTYLVSRSQQSQWISKLDYKKHISLAEILSSTNHNNKKSQITDANIKKNLIVFSYPKLSNTDGLACVKLLMPINK